MVKELGRIFNTHIIHEIMLSGIFSGSSVIRALVVRVVNNLVISDYTIVDWVIYENILSRVLKEKENVKIEISYLLYNFICSDEYERIKKAVKDGLVRTLHEYSIL